MTAVNLGTGVLPGSDAEILQGCIAGQAILHGQDVAEDPTDGQWKLASTVNLTTPRRTGVALGGASTKGAPFNVQIGGRITGTATLVVGTMYVGSATPGSVAPHADLATTQWVGFYGVADTTTSLKLHPFVPGVQVP